MLSAYIRHVDHRLTYKRILKITKTDNGNYDNDDNDDDDDLITIIIRQRVHFFKG